MHVITKAREKEPKQSWETETCPSLSLPQFSNVLYLAVIMVFWSLSHSFPPMVEPVAFAP